MRLKKTPNALRVLREGGAGTVREMHDAICAARGVGYTTVVKQMQ